MENVEYSIGAIMPLENFRVISSAHLTLSFLSCDLHLDQATAVRFDELDGFSAVSSCIPLARPAH
jgi:hypothetical protein